MVNETEGQALYFQRDELQQWSPESLAQYFSEERPVNETKTLTEITRELQEGARRAAEAAGRSMSEFLKANPVATGGSGMDETKTLTLSQFLRERLNDEQATWEDTANDALPLGRQGWRKLAEFMLEDIMSKRAIVDLHAGAHECTEIQGSCVEYFLEWEPCPTLRLLAAPYRHHESFRKEWA